MGVRERIIKDAGKLFFREGIKRVTMDDVAHELGISKRTIYENFKDKNDLLEATLQASIDSQNALIGEMMDTAGNTFEVLVGILKYGHESINRVSAVYFTDLQRFYPKIYSSVFNKGWKVRIQNLKKLLERGKQEGMFRPEINTTLVSKVFSEQLAMLHNTDVFPHDEFPRKEMFETVFLNFIRGISTRKGVDLLEKLLQNAQ
jgi:AcrR family transcriptional regulator